MTYRATIEIDDETMNFLGLLDSFSTFGKDWPTAYAVLKRLVEASVKLRGRPRTIAMKFKG